MSSLLPFASLSPEESDRLLDELSLRKDGDWLYTDDADRRLLEKKTQAAVFDRLSRM